MQSICRFLFVFLATLGTSGCFFGTAAAQAFTDATHIFTSPPRSGVGATMVDVDGDGRTDLIAGESVYLQRDRSFIEINTELQGILGALVADANKDGVREVVFLQVEHPGISNYVPARMAFTPFEELPIATNNFPLVQGSVLLDDDRDGHLDILLGNDGPPDVLLRGSGDGHYTDMSASVLPNVDGGTYGMAAADYDRDGDLDIAIGLCIPLPAANLLYRRDDQAYVEVAASAGVADPLASWGVAWLDYDGDGWLDLFTANMPRLQDNVFFSGFNTLARNNGDGTFTEVAAQAGVAGPEREQSWSAVAADFDNDGWTDLFVANRPEPSRLWRNLGDGTFEDRTGAASLAEITTVAIAAGDVDGDGWIDLFAPSPGQRILFLNQGGNNGWLAIRLRGTASNRDGIGARVEVTAGGRTQVREITGGDGMMSQSHALEAHFGLGTMTEADVTVYWPSGEVTTVSNVAAKQRLTIVEGEGRNDPPGSFALRQPIDGADVQSAGTVTFGWEAAPDDDPVSYT
ncbi:MAG TPA: CRTAC1 family protein, partial [Rhodothermales bacterium]|nr:CRTAC1 family protein [Rhodothermales bacterium]